MIAKIVKGTDFKGVIKYILNPDKGALLIDSKGVFLENNETIARSFGAQSEMNPRVTKAVGHISLSFSKEDLSCLDNAFIVKIAREYMERMGIKDTQYIIGRHFDKEHPHVHIAYNRIDNEGKTISDSNDRFRSERVCKELTGKYGLYFAPGKEQVKEYRLREPDRTRYELFRILKEETGRCSDWDTLLQRLKQKGIDVQFKYKGQTREIQGIVFIRNGYHFNGSKVDRGLSYSKIDARLRHNRYEEQQASSVYPRLEQVQPDKINSERHDWDSLIGDSLGLFTPHTNNVPDEREPYDPYLRNSKKKKKQRKINW